MKHRFAFVALLSFLLFTSLPAVAQDRANLEREIASLKEQLKAKEKEFLEPSPQDKATFSYILNQPDAGLIRLMPRESQQNKLLINGGGAYYSFARLTHEYGYGSDISLDRGLLSVGFAGADFGFLTSLGDVPIESVTQEHPGLDFLFHFETPSEEPKAREQYRSAGAGLRVKEFAYSNSVLARVNTTYALRSVNYRTSDILVVFRVVRKDVDGSLILAWKLLRVFPTPVLSRP